MNMTPEVIEKLQRQGFADRVHEAMEAGSPAVVIPQDCKLQTLEGLEKLEDAPRRFRGHFGTADIEAFSRYINTHGTAESVVYVSDRNMQATAIIDQGTPEEPQWGEHKAALALQTTDPYRALITVCESPRTQQNLAEWLEDWFPLLAFHSDAEAEKEISGGVALQAVRNLKIEAKAETDSSQGDMQGSMTRMEEIAATASKGEMPAVVSMTCAPYHGLKERVINCRVSVITSANEKPKLRLRIVGQQVLEQECVEEFAARIDNENTTDAAVLIGSMNYQK